jgi:hypothetical protein
MIRMDLARVRGKDIKKDKFKGRSKERLSG